jgi:hypothetical protein
MTAVPNGTFPSHGVCAGCRPGDRPECVITLGLVLPAPENVHHAGQERLQQWLQQLTILAGVTRPTVSHNLWVHSVASLGPFIQLLHTCAALLIESAGARDLQMAAEKIHQSMALVPGTTTLQNTPKLETNSSCDFLNVISSRDEWFCDTDFKEFCDLAYCLYQRGFIR